MQDFIHWSGLWLGRIRIFIRSRSRVPIGMSYIISSISMVPTSLSERQSSVVDERSASRALCGNDKRDMRRVKRELQLDLRIGNETKQVYTIDLSQRGGQGGRSGGETHRGRAHRIRSRCRRKKIFLTGIVARDDGSQWINRNGRGANSFFVIVP